MSRLTVYSQHGTQDSTRKVTIEAWRVYRLINDVKKLHVCQELVSLQDEKIASLEALVDTKEGLIINLNEQINRKDYIASLHTQELERRNKNLRKEVKKYKITTFGALLLTILVILHGG